MARIGRFSTRELVIYRCIFIKKSVRIIFQERLSNKEFALFAVLQFRGWVVVPLNRRSVYLYIHRCSTSLERQCRLSGNTFSFIRALRPIKMRTRSTVTRPRCLSLTLPRALNILSSNCCYVREFRASLSPPSPEI